MARKRANGEGNLRKREDGKGWEARYYDPDGKRHSVYGKTQAEVRKKLAAALAELESKSVLAEPEITVAGWLSTWEHDFLGNVKPGTADNYAALLRLHIIPSLGKLKLTELKTPAIQRLYNSKLEQGLSPKSIKNLHGCLHKALDTAVKVGYLVKNPSSACILPRVVQPEIKPLDTPDLTKLLNALHGHEYETLITVDIFTGLRSGELIGLTWDCVDFENGLIRVVKQLLLPRKKGEVFRYGTLKNDKTRTIAPAPFIMDMLKKHKAEQKMQRLRMGPAWEDEGFPDLVFTYPNGHHLTQWNVCRALQKVLKDNGMDPHRFHDLRHTFVVNSFRAGDDAKTVQQNVGHYSAAFTLDRYAHVTATMRKESAERMQKFFERLG